MKPDDISVEIGTKEEAYWTQLRDQSLEAVTASERNILLSQAIIAFCEEKIAAEKKKV